MRHLYSKVYFPLRSSVKSMRLEPVLKKYIADILKVIIVISILWWLVKQGRLDVSTLKLLLTRADIFLLNFILWLTGAIVCSTLRWQAILQGMRVKIPYKDALRLTMIGLSFNSFMPGAVGGDFVKAYYVCRKASVSKTPALLSILLDRIIGLYVILLMAGLVNLYASQANLGHLSSLIWLNTTLLITMTIFFVIIFLPSANRENYFLKVLDKNYLGFSYLKKIYLSTRLLKETPSSFIKALSYSLLFQIQFLFFFFYITKTVHNGPVDFTTLANIYSIGSLSLAIPISPGGLGVGHAVYEKLLITVGISQGANIYNLMFIGQMSFNLLGFIPYLMMKNRNSQKVSYKQKLEES